MDKVEEKKVGIKIRNKVVGVMAFANNLGLLAEDPGGKTILLKCSEDFFDEKRTLSEFNKICRPKSSPT